MLSASLAQALFGREDVVGERVRLPETAMNPTMDLVVVGVLADTLTTSLTAAPDPSCICRSCGRTSEVFRA